MKLLGSTGNKSPNNKNCENVTHLEITEVILVQLSTVNNEYQRDSIFFYKFVPNKPFGQVLMILPTRFIFLKTNPLEIEDRINLTLVMKWYICSKNELLYQFRRCYSNDPRDRIFVKGYVFPSFAKNMGKKAIKTWVVNILKNFLIA